MKKIGCGLLIALSLFASAGAVSAQGAVVLDADTGAVLFEQNADKQLPMASTTKIMTALVAISEGDLDRVYTVKKEYTGVEGSSMYLREGEQITLRDTLYGLLLESGNDAAVAIAGECGGLNAFVQKMNDKAAELGLQNTHFDNPNGLDGETHYTTARELGIIAAAAMQDETFRQIVRTRNYRAGEHTMGNHNKLLSMYDDAVGIKTGFTKRSGRCLVSAAERNGRTLVAVTLNAPDDWNDHMAMLNSGFAQYEEVQLHTAGQVLGTKRVFGGDAVSVPLMAQRTVSAYLSPQERDALQTVEYSENICYAPVVKTAIAGKIEYRIGNKVLAEDNLLYGGASLLEQEHKGLAERLLDKLFD